MLRKAFCRTARRAVYEFVKALPFTQFGFEIDVAFAAEELIEFLASRPVRSLDFDIQLRYVAFDLCVPDAEVFDVPMELLLELMSVVRADFPGPAREFIDDVMNEIDHVGLGVLIKPTSSRSA